MLDEINLRQKEDMEKSQRSMAEVLHRVQEETTLPLDVYGDNGEEEAMEELQKRIENGEDIQLEDLRNSSFVTWKTAAERTSSRRGIRGG